MQFLVSAGEASGDLYASAVVNHLATLLPGSTFYGCAGPRLRDAGVRPIVDAGEISVVGLAEVVSHLPRIYGEYRKLVEYAKDNVPDAAILTDNPDFNLRLARQLRALGVPIFYLVAPQVWAWRQGRVTRIRELVDSLYCLFPFEEPWFRKHGVNATYIGHPLATLVRPSFRRDEFFARHRLHTDERMLVLLPGSRGGEIARHLPLLLDTVRCLRTVPDLQVVLATPKGFQSNAALANFRERMAALSIQVIENETWDCIAHATVALAASGTVTMEAAVLGTPMVTFYKVNPLSWYGGRHMVKAPYLSMVNLIAGRLIVPELIQYDMSAENLARAVTDLFNPAQAERMRRDLAVVREALISDRDPLARTAVMIADSMSGGSGDISGSERVLVQERME